MTFATGSYLIFDGVTSSARPLYMGGVSAGSDLRLEVISTDSALPLAVVLAEYATSGSCVTSFANSSIDGCPTAATCYVVGQADASNSSQCTITYLQLATGAEGSDEALLALFSLVALVPLAVVFALCVAKSGALGPPAASALSPEFELDYPELVPAPDPMHWPTPRTPEELAYVGYF